VAQQPFGDNHSFRQRHHELPHFGAGTFKLVHEKALDVFHLFPESFHL
jgi:hypothetical protein